MKKTGTFSVKKALKAIAVEAVLFVLLFFSVSAFGTSAFSVWVLTRGLFVVCFAFATLLASALYAVVQLGERRWYRGMGAFFGIALSAFFGLHWFMLVPVVLYYGAAALLYRLAKGRKSRLVSAGVIAVFLGAVAAAVATYLIFARYGSFDVEAMRADLGWIREQIILFFTQAQSELNTSVEMNLLSEEEISLYASALLLAAPGVVLSMVFALGYYATTVMRLLLRQTGNLELLYKDGFCPTPSIPTAVLFALCMVVTSLFGAMLSDAVAATFAALAALFEVLFAFTGFSNLIRLIDRRRRPNYTMRNVLCLAVAAGAYATGVLGGVELLALFLMPIYLVSGFVLFPLLYFFGLIHTVFTHLKARASRSSHDK